MVVQVTAPFQGLDPRWPLIPCTIPCAISESERIEIRFEPSKPRGLRVSRFRMRIVKIGDSEKVLEEIPVKLVFWDAIRYFGLWPPHPIDLLSFQAEGVQLEALISDLNSNPTSDGNSSWRVTYSPRTRRWKIEEERCGARAVQRR